MLKTYLQALLSRFYSKASADKAEISGLSAIDVSNGVVIENVTASPKNGFVVVESTAEGSNSHATYIYVDGRVINGFRNMIPTGQTYITHAPVKKGAQILVDTSGAKVTKLTVCGLMGGG